ncbi:hypothetical protein NP493_1376g01038 [Ridgeia piscesae]|uniref:F-box domain-containing protein n=1 Tax=Ridgeia piscesae TaxID=27915 RepID=A0AAD9K5C6_RIDPI|nr:hypothetical protein NP493_1376g01038 [Ridgeia piscesae]
MKLRVRLGKRTIVCSFDDSHGEPTVVSTKEQVRDKFDLADLPFSLSLNRCDLLDEEANLTLRNLGIVSGDLIFVVVASDHDTGEEHNENDNRIPDDDTAAAAAENMDVAQDRGETLATEMPLGGPAVSHSHNTGVTITPSGNPDELLIHDAEAIHDAMSNHYLNEPMFVRDSTGATVPHTLRAIVESGDIENSHDAICTVLHLLMLEAGFRSSSSSGSEEKLPTRMPRDWKCPGTYRLSYEHVSCDGSSFQLLCVPLGTVITIHGTVRQGGDAESQTRELNLNVNEFVSENHSGGTEMFHNLPKLSRLFKDGLVYWLLQMGQPDGDAFLIPCLMGLPTELKLNVMRHLDALSLVRMSAVCKELLVVARERCLWRKLYLRDYGRKTDNNLDQDWLKLYRDKTLERRAIRDMYTEQTLIFTSSPFPSQYPPFNPFMPTYDPFNPFHPTGPMPGFIGGEYDLRPNFPGPLGGVPRPRFDPFSPFPSQRFWPVRGRGRGLWDTRGRFGPRFM